MSRRDDAWLMFQSTGLVALICVGGWGLMMGMRWVATTYADLVTRYQELLTAFLLMGSLAAAFALLAFVVWASSSREEMPKPRPGEDHMETVERLKKLEDK